MNNPILSRQNRKKITNVNPFKLNKFTMSYTVLYIIRFKSYIGHRIMQI